MTEYKVFIRHKDEITDAESEKIRKDIRDLGIRGIREITVYQMYKISGDISSSGIEKICRELLVDTIAQVYYIGQLPGHQGFSIEVDYKKGVTDSVADTVFLGITDMNMKADLKIKTGKKFILEGDLIDEQVKRISEKILANTMIQEYNIIHAGQ
ncbi:MAG: phosphoribosylformylglycinamidine synthase subunit PurS [bacterium]|nr:phosphoribosylformylglycinamidine synthase subunit PurS [bacterium]